MSRKMSEPSPDTNNSGRSTDVLVLICTQSFTAEALVDDILLDALYSAGFTVETQLVDDAGFDWAGVIKQTEESSSSSSQQHKKKAKAVLIVASTFGDGDPPSHASEFASWLGREHTQEDMGIADAAAECFPLSYCVFGLGDRTYTHFAAFGKFIDEKLEARGYNRLYPFTAGDVSGGDQAGQFSKWCNRVVKALQSTIGPGKSSSDNPPNPFPCGTGADWQRSAIQHGSITASVISAKELTDHELSYSSSYRSVVEVGISVGSNHVPSDFQPGDHVGIYPRNSLKVVDRALKWLDISGGTETKIMVRRQIERGTKWEEKQLSARDFLLMHVDLAGRATPAVLRSFLPFIGTLELRALARDLTHISTSSSAADEYDNEVQFDSWVAGRHLTAFDLATLFECRPSLQAFARACGPIQPRLYSVSSVSTSSSDDQAQTLIISLCVSIIEGGLCSNYLKRLASERFQSGKSDRIDLFLRPSRFRFVSDDKPYLLVATGSGIGPFIGFLEREVKRLKEGGDSNPIDMFYGCRTKSDVLYKQRLGDICNDMTSLSMHVTFSRLPGHAKTYVQDSLRREATCIWKHIFVNKGKVYVCGRLEMLSGIRAALVDIAKSVGKMEEGRATRVVNDVESEGRLITDCWSIYTAKGVQASMSVSKPPRVVVRLERHHQSPHGVITQRNVSIDVPAWPSYLRLLASGELEYRVVRAMDMWSACVACGRSCETNRLSSNPDDWGECRVGTNSIVASVFPHFGEEECLVGTNGSGTIFFGACNVKCQYCQNWELSAIDEGVIFSDDELANAMIALQHKGCHNINFVSPTHNVAPILRALLIAARKGLRLPLVWNTGGYDSVASLRLLEGVVDIYMPDAKYASRAAGRKLSKVDNYPEINQAAIKEMHRQVGDLQIDRKSGLAKRGVLVRHLILPCDLAGTCDVTSFLAKEISKETFTNIMDQYRPEHKAKTEKKYGLSRRPTGRELRAAHDEANHSGLRRFDGDQPPKKRTLEW